MPGPFKHDLPLARAPEATQFDVSSGPAGEASVSSAPSPGARKFLTELEVIRFRKSWRGRRQSPRPGCHPGQPCDDQPPHLEQSEEGSPNETGLQRGTEGLGHRFPAGGQDEINGPRTRDLIRKGHGTGHDPAKMPFAARYLSDGGSDYSVHSTVPLSHLLKARQHEREPCDASLKHPEQFPQEELVFDDADGPGELGNRFGCVERDVAEEVRKFLEAPEPTNSRGKAGLMVRVSAIIGSGAFVALVGISLGGTHFTGIDEEPPESMAVPAKEAVSLASGPTVTPRSGAQDHDSIAAARATRAMLPKFVQSEIPSFVPTPEGAVSQLDESDHQIEIVRTAPVAEARAYESTSPPADALVAEEAADGAEEVAALSPEMVAPGESSASGDTATRPAQATSAVNMRAEPVSAARVLAIIPAGGEVELIGCDYWCEVVYEGRHGWVYRDYVSISSPAVASAPDGGASDPAEEAAAASSDMAALPEEAATTVAATTRARATTHVNMRAQPENSAAVLAVIPAGSEVERIGCNFWCEVVYDGQQGWVYRDFVAGAE